MNAKPGKLLLGGLLLVGTACSSSDNGPPKAQGEVRATRVVAGLAHPESALYDETSDTWIVSNQGEMNVPGDGFLIRLSGTGDVLVPRFVEGLDDPKGMGVSNGSLFVADGDHVVVIDLGDPAHPQRIAVPGAAFLNDVAVDRSTGDVYVSDTFGNAIVRVRNRAAEVVIRDKALESPNGLLVEGRILWVASVGPDLDPQTFHTSAPGRVFRVDLDGLTIEPFSGRFGGLDGIARDGDSLLVSDTFVGLYRVDAAGSAVLIADSAKLGLMGAADIGFGAQRRLVAVPELFGSELTFLALP